MGKLIKIGTRGSNLALAQAQESQSRLMAATGLPSQHFKLVVIKTTGDMVQGRPLAEIGGKGLFTKELEEALLAGHIDMAVHSMKDMPAQIPKELCVACVLPREDARDAFISTVANEFSNLPQGARLGSSSVRRLAQGLHLRPDLVAVPFRGNVETRLAKLQDGVADATFLGVAGLKRLKLESHITQTMPIELMLPAIAQGAIGIEIKQGNESMADMLRQIDHDPSHVAVACERAFMVALDGSCRSPIAGHATIIADKIHFRGEALTLDGRKVFTSRREGRIADAEKLGADAGAEVRLKGGAALGN